MINNCKTCKKDFTKPSNPTRIYKYCSLKCMGADKEKSEAHGIRMRGRTAWNKNMKGLQLWHDISGLSGKGDIPWNYKGVPILYPSLGRFITKGKKNARVVAEQILGRPLLSGEIIHHINENKADDRPENLYLFRDRAAHMGWHSNLRIYKQDGNIIKSNLSLYSLLV